MTEFTAEINVFGTKINITVDAEDMDAAIDEVMTTPVLELLKDTMVSDVCDAYEFYDNSYVEEI